MRKVCLKSAIRIAVELSRRAPIIEGGGSNTVGMPRPMVRASQKNNSQKPKNRGTPSDTTQLKPFECASSAMVFSTASQPCSQAAMASAQTAPAIPSCNAAKTAPAATRLINRSNWERIKIDHAPGHAPANTGDRRSPPAITRPAASSNAGDKAPIPVTSA